MQKIDLAELRRLWAKARTITWGIVVPNATQKQEISEALDRTFDALPALLDELEAARAELEALKVPLAIYERHTKAIGAAEWLEANNERLDTMNRADVEQEAAKLRQEAEANG